MSQPTTNPEEVIPVTLDDMVESAARSHKWDKRVKWGLFWTVMIGGLIGFFWLGQVTADRDVAKAEAASEQQAKKEIAVEAQAALCQSGELAVYDAKLCGQLEEIAEEPAKAEAGPQGVPGKDSVIPGPTGPAGKDGKDGADGDTGPPGAAGDTGLTGATGADGPPGLTGAPGNDSTAPGPAGPAGAAGSDGAPGADGTNGRGIASVTCEGIGDTSYWLVTYDDGTTQTSGGPCRIEAAAAPVPAPTDSP